MTSLKQTNENQLSQSLKLSTNALFHKKDPDSSKRATPLKISMSRTASSDSLKLRSGQTTQILKKQEHAMLNRPQLAFSDATNLVIPQKQTLTSHKTSKIESRS